MRRLRAEDPTEDVMQAVAEDDLSGDDLRLGDMMRGERATLGKSLLDVQRELRIKASYVAAIENCDVTAFDMPSFVAGYVRSYARYLGMDSDWTFRRFCAESGFQPMHGLTLSAAAPRSTRQTLDPAEALANPHALFIPQSESVWSQVQPRAVGAILVLIALVCGLGYGGWSVLQEVQRVTLSPAEDAPGVVTALDPAMESGMDAPPLDLADTPEVAGNLSQPESLDRLYRPQILEAPVLTARDGPIAAIDPGFSRADQTQVAAAQGSPLPDDGRDPAVSDPMQYGPQAPAGAPAAITVAATSPEMELLTARPAWVRVTASDGTVLLEKIMDAGERFTLPALEEAPLLRTGNSGAVYFAVNGQTYGPAAPGPQVVKNIALSPDSVKAAYALADLNADPELAQMIALAQADTAPVDGPATE